VVVALVALWANYATLFEQVRQDGRSSDVAAAVEFDLNKPVDANVSRQEQ
jgi:hypothetical protein